MLTFARKRTGQPEMSENELAEQLAQKMRQQLELRSQVEQMQDAAKIAAAVKQLDSLRNDCIELMERYFRLNVYPMIARRFPGKIGPDKYVAQFTQLLSDFFIEIKQRFDDPLWVKTSPAELRGYASTVITRDVHDLMRRNRIGEEATAAYALKQAIAQDAEQRMAEDHLNLKQVLEIFERWDASENDELRNFAQVLRLYYIVELTDDEVDRDAAITLKGRTLAEISQQVGKPIATVGRWRQQALAALRDEIADDSASNGSKPR